MPQQQERRDTQYRPNQLTQQGLPLLTGHLACGQGAVGFHPGWECQGHHDCFSSAGERLKRVTLFQTNREFRQVLVGLAAVVGDVVDKTFLRRFEAFFGGKIGKLIGGNLAFRDQ